MGSDSEIEFLGECEPMALPARHSVPAGRLFLHTRLSQRPRACFSFPEAFNLEALLGHSEASVAAKSKPSAKPKSSSPALGAGRLRFLQAAFHGKASLPFASSGLPPKFSATATSSSDDQSAKQAADDTEDDSDKKTAKTAKKRPSRKATAEEHAGGIKGKKPDEDDDDDDDGETTGAGDAGNRSKQKDKTPKKRPASQRAREGGEVADPFVGS